MITHYIILSSSYSEKTRIALRYTFDKETIEKDTIQSPLDAISKSFDGKYVSYSVHVVHTDSEDWDSVVKKDGYFKDVRLIESLDEFISLIQKDREFKGIDVAAYIASKKPCTHSRLEKLTYYCYAEYLCKTGKKLFTDKVYAFEHRPVIETVYATLKEFSSQKKGSLLQTQEREPENKTKIGPGIEPMSIKSKLLFAEDGQGKVCSIDETLSKFDKYPTQMLVEMTHRERTPWSVTKRDRPYTRISDSDILKYHVNEI